VEEKPFSWPLWASVTAIVSLIAGPLLLMSVWPDGGFLAGLIPTAFLTLLFAGMPSEFRDNPRASEEMRARITVRSDDGWRRAWIRASVGAGVLLLAAIVNDWMMMRFGE
jgi:multisubunit Na+/H+ antiporter MnhB subunit